MTGTPPARLAVGLVRGFRGLRGHVRVELLTDRPEDRFVVGDVPLPGGSVRRPHHRRVLAVADGTGWWLRFAELPDREAADSLRDAYLEIEPPEEPREPGRWYFHELEGLAVRGSDGAELGRVVEIYRAGGAEVFLVRGPRGEVDVPGVKGIVLELDPERARWWSTWRRWRSTRDPVDDDYVRPRDRRPANPKQPRPPKPPREAPVAPPAAAPKGKAARRARPGTRAPVP